jgi:AraC-like DNA-binding protein
VVRLAHEHVVAKVDAGDGAIGSEPTIAAAAHAADFADAAHPTRTFYQMFGMAPSVLMRGELIETPSPFGAPSNDKRGRQFPRRPRSVLLTSRRGLGVEAGAT